MQPVMNRVIVLSLLLVCSGFFGSAVAKDPPPQILGIRLGMSKEDARGRLRKLGSLEKEARKRQEVWALTDPRISHLIIGFDPELHVRYVTAIARVGSAHINYSELAEVKAAQQAINQGNFKFTWEVRAKKGRPAYVVIAHGRNPQYLETYSVKKVDNKPSLQSEEQ